MAAAEVDLASGLLWGAGVTAVAEHPEGEGRVRLRADVPAGGVAAVQVLLGDRWPVAAVDVADDGLDTWRDHAQTVTAGRRLVVRPPWVPLGDVAGDAVVLEIDPGRSFGHGAHPTTLLCLAAVEELVESHPDAAVLDIGCGSGVLAVAAARLGARRVVAVDIDEAAIAATRDNAARNGAAEQVEVVLVPAASREVGPEVDLNGPDAVDGSPGESGGASADSLAAVGGTFDVVVANIGARALVDLAPALRAHLAGGGTLVLSGLLDPPPPEVADAFAPLTVVDVRRRDGWAALLLDH